MNLKQRLQTREPTLGTFVKTTHYHNTEVLSRTALHVLCLDAEHAPFDRSDLDKCVLAARASQKPVLVRIPDSESATILNTLDIGATGIVVPHVKTAEQINDIIKYCYFGDGGRGYAGSSRFAEYTTSTIADNLAKNRSQTCVIAQIEDLCALDQLDAICQVEHLDCLFIGTMDLTVALKANSPKDASVERVITNIVETARRHNVTLGMFVSDLNELPDWLNKGVSLFLLGSDHSFILSGAKQLSATFDAAQSTIA
ncbi:HpcH/HpaI aldolase family protein [Agaribacter flavus]|uniref:HpcH/HpaI aldolase/citrate lyase family protein n=1 Tax=Agaribacter flavus TaxID=1902781 RepID=A0ABV7FSN4_9ALTE